MNGLDGFAALCAALGKNEANYDVSAASTYTDKAAVYLKRLKLIASGYNGGKKVNLADTNQRKYYAWCWIEKDESVSGGFRLAFSGSVFGVAGAGLGARPYFLNDDDVKPAFEKWQAEFEGWMQNEALALMNEEY